MVYRSGKKYRGRRRFKRRSRRGRSGRMTAYRVRRIINAELKVRFLSVALGDITQGTGNLVAVTSPIAVGGLAGQRVGNWIKPINLHGQVTLTGEDGAAESLFNVRCGFIQWMNDEQFDPVSVAQIIEDPVSPFGPLNFGNRGSFKQLWSRKYILSNDVQNSQFLKTIPFYIKLRVKQCTYDDGNPKKFQLYFYVLGDHLLATAPKFSLDFTCRYTDS